MSEHSWSRAELTEHVRGKHLTQWSPATLAQLPVPQWLLAPSAGTVLFDLAEMTRRTHPEDRGVANALLGEAMQTPGEVVTGTYRFRGDHGWVEVTSEVLSLVDHPEVGALLGATTLKVMGPATPSAFAPWDRPLENRSKAAETVLLPYDLPLDVGSVEAAPAAPTPAPAVAPTLTPSTARLSFTADEDGRIVSHTGDWRDVRGGDVELSHLQDVVHPGDRTRFDGILRFVTEQAPIERKFEVRGRTGRRLLAFELHGAVDDGYTSLSGSVADITMAAARQRRSDSDYLTGLLNHRAIERRLAAALESEDHGVMLLLLDLDGFAAVNEQHGRDSGDVVLAAVAKRLRMAVRTTDEVGRWGSDEFAIVCRDAGAAEGDTLVHRLAESFKHPVSFATGAWRPAATIGIARFRAGDDVTALLTRASDALDDAKLGDRAVGGTAIRSLVG